MFTFTLTHKKGGISKPTLVTVLGFSQVDKIDIRVKGRELKKKILMEHVV